MARLRMFRVRSGIAKPPPPERTPAPAAPSARWDRLYDLRIWRRKPDGLRWSCLVAAQFTCAMCGRVDASHRMVADHITPHRGNMDLFTDAENLQCLCAECHSGEKARREVEERERSGGLNWW
ncbi:HNH endonuclease [Paroceanicella profunda]|uniref:HNH endonuclease n=1 Tax=Paroceanicella profunda TaxID=2579971 RepID=A0A5B8FHS5_9RHOB|nr:HNH endonuclease signature motif containing protein [Paroceanicella profunda]QDL92537.1 HNH endonuclease [Paroceanicella profunda]